ncbi:MAG: DUF3800 domain-containing protein [Candidatus Moranbacteria bacterium]|nr:DUF3800 domain-containing protein [Candidatus Moranbacteria bacterium]
MDIKNEDKKKNYMHIFVDESGIHKETGKSSVALVYVLTEDVKFLNEAIIGAEKSLRIKNFHWTDCSWKIRVEFFKFILKENFSVRVSIIRNPFNKNDFEESIKLLLLEKKFKKVVIDGKKPKWYALKMKKLLRDSGISVKKINMANDEAYPCLRLADAYAGLSRAYWEGRENKNVDSLYEIARKKIKTTQLVDGQTVQ